MTTPLEKKSAEIAALVAALSVRIRRNSKNQGGIVSDTKPIQMTAEEAALHKEYRRLLMVREDERDHARIAEVIAAINAFHPSLRPLDEDEIERRIAERKARKRLEQLRNLPRVTAADRERYKRWEQEARAELAEVEPKHAKRERAEWRNDWDRDHAGWNDSWRSYWRSLPDYDGPPMRAPSGVRVSIGTGPSDLILSSALYPPKKKGELPRMVYTKVAITSPWTEIDPPLDDYGHPSAGGRGWCRGLAGVSE